MTFWPLWKLFRIILIIYLVYPTLKTQILKYNGHTCIHLNQTLPTRTSRYGCLSGRTSSGTRQIFHQLERSIFLVDLISGWSTVKEKFDSVHGSLTCLQRELLKRAHVPQIDRAEILTLSSHGVCLPTPNMRHCRSRNIYSIDRLDIL